jgi:hypothetical protein
LTSEEHDRKISRRTGPGEIVDPAKILAAADHVDRPFLTGLDVRGARSAHHRVQSGAGHQNGVAVERAQQLFHRRFGRLESRK